MSEFIVSYDTETKGLEWWGTETAFLATTHDSNGNSIAYDLSNGDHVQDFLAHLRLADVLVAHNLSFDCHQVFATLGFDILDLPATLHDTDIMARICWPEGQYGEHGGFGLKNLAKVFIDPHADTEEEAMKEAAKQIGMRTMNKTGAYYDVWRAFPHIVEAYAKDDARYTWLLYEKLVAALAKPEASEQAWVYYQEEQPIMEALIRGERRGTRVDRPKVKALHKKYLREQKRLHDSLETQLGETALGGEGKEQALIEAFQKNGVPLWRMTDSGEQLAVNKFALSEFEAEHPVVREYQEYATTNKFLSTYIEPMLKTEVIHPDVRQIGAWTGRMSCRRPNMQNIPVRSGSDVREVLIPRDGFKLVVNDYDSIEPRLLAYYLGDAGETFRNWINEGYDTHAHMAAILAQNNVQGYTFGTDMADYLKDTAGEKMRAQAKHTFMAILYGAGGRRVCDMNGLPTGPPLKEGDWEVRKGIAAVGAPSYAEGKRVARLIKNSIPGYGALMRRIKAKVEGHGYIRAIDGRKQALARDKGYIGMSALLQGSAAGIMKIGLRLAADTLDAYEGHLLMVVHDEVIAEVPDHLAAEAQPAIAESLAAAWPGLNPPLVVSGGVYDNYGEAK